MALADAKIHLAASRFSINDWSSDAWTAGQTACVTKSNTPCGTGNRFNSAKKATIPPPIGTPGNALLAAVAISK
ncbi:MAG: hypothetical protein F4103_11630 [Boseongicola sp. SB0673_bin_14]|nr:hypothetical protein [Boseongicola sp. SB0673_bin_14]